MATTVIKTIAPSGQSGDYLSLNAWEAGEQNDLTTGDLISLGVISGNWSGVYDTASPVSIDGWTTSATNYVGVITTGSARHCGVWDASKYIFNIHPNHGLNIYEEYTKVDGLQVWGTGLPFRQAINNKCNSANADIYITNNIIRGDGLLIGIADDVSTYQSGRFVNIYNNLIYGITGDNTYSILLQTSANRVFNNTISTVGGYGILQSTAGNETGFSYLRNNIVIGASVSDYGQADHMSGGDYNISYDSTADDFVFGNGNINSRLPLFINSGAGDYRLSPYDTGAILQGTGLSSIFTTDIAQTSRGTGNTWDIGAYHSPSYIRTIKNTSGHYNSVAAWEAAEQQDLTLVNKASIAEFGVTGDWYYTYINGWTTSPTNYIHISGSSLNSHSGYLDLTKNYFIDKRLTFYEQYLRLEKLQWFMRATAEGNEPCLNNQNPVDDAATLTVDDCIFTTINPSGQKAVYFWNNDNGSGNYRFTNCVFDNFSGSNGAAIVLNEYGAGRPTTLVLNNCSMRNCARGMSLYISNGSIVSGYNNLFCNLQYDIESNIKSLSYSATSLTTGVNGLNTGNNNTFNQTFTFLSTGLGDVRLSPYDTGAILKGTGLSHLFTKDVAGTFRGTGTTWDIGAYHAPEMIRTIKPAGQSGSYNSLSAWEAGQQRDLTLVNKVAKGEIGGNWSGADSNALVVDGWITSADNYVEIYTTGNARHNGSWNPSYHYLQQSGSVNTIYINEDFTKLKWLQATNLTSSIGNGIRILGISGEVDGCIVKGYDTTQHSAGIMSNTDGVLVRNCVVSDYRSTGGVLHYGFEFTEVVNRKLYNNTCVNCDYSFVTNSSVDMMNCLSNNCPQGFHGGASAASSNNLSNLASDAPGLNPRTGAALFMDSGNGDFRLSPYDTGAMLRGTGLSHIFTTDIVGTSRGTGTVWDIGAHHSTEIIKTVKPSGQSGNYNSLSAWEAGEQRDLTIINKIEIAEIDGNWTEVDPNQLDINGYTTDIDNYLVIRAVGSARHAGKWDNTKYILSPTVSPTTRTYENYTRYEGLQMTTQVTGASIIVHFGFSFYNTIDSCLVVANGPRADSGICYGIIAETSGSLVKNCVVTNAKSADASSAEGFSIQYNSVALNCTAYNCGRGFRAYPNDVATVINCLAQNCNDGFFTASNWHTGSSNNCSDLSSDTPGANPHTGTVQFVNAANGDFRLSSEDTVAKGQGVNLSSLFTTDVGGNTRTEPWDIGASIWFDVSVSGANVQISSPISDVSTGFWSIAPLYEKIDEISPSDSDYIYSSTNPSNDTCEVLLTGAINPNVHTGHYLTYRYQKELDNSNQINLVVGLYEGTTLISQQTHNDIPYGWITTGFYLTSGEAATITNYNNIRVRLTANKV